MEQSGREDALATESSPRPHEGLAQEHGPTGIFPKDTCYDTFRCAESEHPMRTHNCAASAVFAGITVGIHIVARHGCPCYVVADDKSVSEKVGATTVHGRERLEVHT